MRALRDDRSPPDKDAPPPTPLEAAKRRTAQARSDRDFAQMDLDVHSDTVRRVLGLTRRSTAL